MHHQPAMTARQLREAQQALGLPDRHLAAMLGVTAQALRRLKVEDSAKPSARSVSPTLARLLAAYLAGYRPADWPAPSGRGD